MANMNNDETINPARKCSIVIIDMHITPITITKA